MAPLQLMSESPHNFESQLNDLRAAYWKKREGKGLYCLDGPPLLDLNVETVRRYSYWFGQGSSLRSLRIYDKPGTLSGDILRLKAKLPDLTGDWEIDGDIIRPFSDAPAPPPEEEDWDTEFIAENVSEVAQLLERLPTIDDTSDGVFLKKPQYASEIVNLLKCQGGSCPGTPSPYVVQLLGKSKDGRLVFPKLLTRARIIGPVYPPHIYTSWFQQLIKGVQELHSYGIIHRDLKVDNLLWTQESNNHTLLVCDLESRWGMRDAPEVVDNGTLDAAWTEASDIWDIGELMKHILYGNPPANPVIEWTVPAPFTDVVAACQRPIPTERASLIQLLQMLDAIAVS